jgi:hypothetical protein
MCAAIASAATREPPPRFVRPLVSGVYAGCAVETRLSFAGSKARANYFRWRTLIEGACIEPELALVGAEIVCQFAGRAGSGSSWTVAVMPATSRVPSGT